jgi:predicted ester cyclase
MAEQDLEANKQVAQVYVHTADVVSRKEADWSDLRVLTAPDFQLHTPGKDRPVDFDGFIAMSSQFMNGFPGFEHIIDFQVAEGDKVVNVISWRGTHNGTFHGVAPTHRKVTMRIINIMRFEDGKIAEFWRLSDIEGLMKQITVPL